MARILVIDDNELIGKMLNETLSEDGYEVRTALDANRGYREAVDFMPDLILLDIQLPDVTGYDLCRMIKNKAELRDVPVIMITGTARSTEEKVKGFQLGIDDYLLKPFEMAELLERVRAVLRRSEGRRQTPSPSRSEEVQAEEKANIPARVPLLRAVYLALILPRELAAKPFVPGISLVFLLASVGLNLAALAFSSAETPPALVGLSTVGLWGLAVAVLVVASTLAGIRMSWKEGAGLVSLAATPLLLKFAGALVTSLATTLSPFYYSAGLALLWGNAPRIADRLDAFEIWGAALLWMFLARWPGSSRKKSWILTLLVWGVIAALAMAVSGMGKP